MTKRVQDIQGAGRLIPTGTVFPFAGNSGSSPSGWAFCGGQAISRTNFADLFATIGTQYGSGDGSTTFNVPDMRGRLACGRDDMNGSAANRITSGGSGVNGISLGAVGGVQTHGLSTAELGSHSHDLQNHTHSATHDHANTSSGGQNQSHTHSNMRIYGGIGVASGGNNSASGGSFSDNTGGASVDHSHNTDLPSLAVTTGAPSNNTSTASGSGTAHQNVQPTIILNYIIKL